DRHADTVIDAEILPVLLTLHRRSLDRLAEFAQPREPLDTGSLQTHVRAELRKKSREMEAQLAQSQRRGSVLMNVKLDAPLVRVHPPPGATHQLVLNLGIFFLSSHAEGGEGGEEAEARDSYALQGSNISVGFYDSALGWDALQAALHTTGHYAPEEDVFYDAVRDDQEDGAVSHQPLPVLTPSNLEVCFEVGPMRHPTHPRHLARLKIPMIDVTVSPERMKCLQQAIDALTTSTIDRKDSQPPWAEAVYSGRLKLLRSNRMGRLVARRRWAALQGSDLFLLQNRQAATWKESLRVGVGQHIVPVPESDIGVPHVFAVTKEAHRNGAQLVQAMKFGRSTWLLQAPDEGAYARWFGYLIETNRMLNPSLKAPVQVTGQEEAGALAVSGPGDEEEGPCTALQLSVELSQVRVAVHGRAHTNGGARADNEVPLVEVVATETELGLTQSDHSLLVKFAMAALQVNDELSGALNLKLGMLVSTGSGLGEAEKSLVIQYTHWPVDAPSYDNVDAELGLELNTLHFYCNRRTLVALMAIPQDMFGSSAPAPEGGSEATDVVEAGMAVPTDEARVLLRLKVAMSGVALRLSYEDGDSLGLVSINNLSSEVQSFANRLRLTASLGGVQIVNDTVDAQNANRWICQKSNRNAGSGTSQSLLMLHYESFDRAAETYPGHDCAVQVQAAELSIVYLSCFVNLVTAYISELSAALPVAESHAAGETGKALPPLPSKDAVPPREGGDVTAGGWVALPRSAPSATSWTCT
ncbi:hypothetical protein CYMTET_23953, partial [Cymbomonas tetramitiformis]